MLKKELRQKYKELRKQLSENEIEEWSLQIANQLIRLDIWQHSFYHLFLPIESQKEVNTEYILQVLAGKDKNIVLSKSDFSTREMTHFLLTDNTTIKKNEYDIPEPIDGLEVLVSKIDVVFVPLLAFDEKGNRVGYGKGFYDKFLAACKPEILKIGVSFFESEKVISDVLNTDIQLDFCVTPTKVYNF
ncbi:5-formyltetrahydrofolate cyclo-ligase [Flavobacterium sp. F372]|uniref:5-formyltetrahydrofolate cyclo-ligase n=1 Tax=Flavobacterium bernardetii TaxID=2813823 RepID=A0ABR7IYU1_9FLAO|nr:5-formyltetrahydrofolate cyclo-ligase [Flavobacterium bernardetii]MBC5834922.1 5-formyltetrahydrofolate cyclo-ligase [Flavobacterium bernardetii]NHF70525.1 5-formyltetrahydrofolate cyclo-ligase [Flavobacterium bernardetii]